MLWPLLSLAITGAAVGAELHVPSEYATIQGAVIAAQDGDEVVIAPGVYIENVFFNGADITLRGSTLSEDVVVSGISAAESVFRIVLGETISIRNITIADGAPSILDDGGGLFVGAAGQVHMEDCIIRDNMAGAGDGVALDNAHGSTFRRCVFAANGQASDTSGGGLFVRQSDSVVIEDCEFVGNKGRGAGIYCLGGNDLLISRCWIHDNIAGSQYGGGLYLLSVFNGLISECLISGNSGTRGGGIYTTSSAVTIQGCTVVGNTANVVGGIDLAGATLVGSIIWGNTPSQVEASSSPDIRHCCIEGGYPGMQFSTIADPLFVDFAGGDYHLSGASPLLEYGGIENPSSLDLDGLPRVVGTAIDLGCFEHQSPPCIGDIDLDGAVGFGDLVSLLSSWGPCSGCTADFDGSGGVGFGDLTTLLSAWGECP